MAPRYRAGTEVEVFYRLERDGEGYFPVSNYAARCLKPRFGMTDGWMRAKVLDDWYEPTAAAAAAAATAAAATCSAEPKAAASETAASAGSAEPTAATAAAASADSAVGAWMWLTRGAAKRCKLPAR